jgi:EAL domain-containing protein (putative c-di-GMP-specific phosphodiesterase class I)
MRTSLNTKQSREHLPDHEELLLDYAERLRKHLPGRRAVHLRLSGLQPINLRSQNLRIAADFFTELVQRFEGQQYVLKNKDIVVVVKGASVSQVDEVVLRLRYLFSDDPLVHDDEDTEFCHWYALEKDYPEFLSLAKRLHRESLEPDESKTTKPKVAARVAAPDLPEPTEPLTPARLGQIETAIAGFDLSAIIRRQMVCVVLKDAAPKPVFNEAYFSIDELRRRLMPETDLKSDRWLFQRLTCSLDLRLLKMLPELEAEVSLPTSINLNVSSLLDGAFSGFDREFRARQSKSLIVEVQPFDVIADMEAFGFARNLAHTKGYKICLDGLSSFNLPLLQRNRLELDLAKIFWRTEEFESTDEASRNELAEVVRAAGSTRVVLCHCDDERALDFGRSLGITLFQGHYIDSLLS